MNTTTDNLYYRLLRSFLQHSPRQTDTLGSLGERMVQTELKRKLFYLWDMNWRVPEGEIDIVAQFDSALHFIEVKTRMTAGKNGICTPEQAVDIHKTEKLRLLADLYLYKKQAAIRRYKIKSMQFDIAAVTIANRHLARGYSIEMHWNAFPFQTANH